MSAAVASPAASPTASAPTSGRPARAPKAAREGSNGGRQGFTVAGSRGRGKGPRGDAASRPPRPAQGDAPARTQDGANGNNGKGQGKPKKQAPKSAANPKSTTKSQEVENPKLAQLKQKAGDYFMDDILLGALKTSNGDVDAAFALLNQQKQGSWSSIVSKSQGAPLTQKATPAPSAAAAPRAAESAAAPPKGSNKKKDNAPVAQAPQPVDPEVQISEFTKQIEQTAREAEDKAQSLKTLQSEIEAISAPRDAEIARLTTEKESCIARNKAINDELAANAKRIKEIDASVESIKKEKLAKISEVQAKAAAQALLKK